MILLKVTQTVSVDKETTLTGSVVAGAAMTILSQSQPETQSPIGPPSSPPKRQTIIGCWNVRTMAETKRPGQVAKEMKGYWIKVVTGIDEVCPELLRADMEDTVSRVTSCHKKLWET